MPFGPGLSFRQQLLLQACDKFRVLAMRGDNHAQPFGKLQSLIHFAVIDAEEVLVREKDFERCGAVRHNLPQLRFGLLHELGYRHVEGVVARAFAFGLGLPELIALQRVIVAIRAAHFDVRSRSADKRRDAAGFMRVLGKSRHERKIDVHVRIDEAGKNQFARGVDHFGIRRSLQILADARDSLVFHVDVRLHARAHRHDFAVPDQQSHLSLPRCAHLPQ